MVRDCEVNRDIAGGLLSQRRTPGEGRWADHGSGALVPRRSARWRFFRRVRAGKRRLLRRPLSRRSGGSLRTAEQIDPGIMHGVSACGVRELSH
jgi:hypothetical protein